MPTGRHDTALHRPSQLRLPDLPGDDHKAAGLRRVFGSRGRRHRDPDAGGARPAQLIKSADMQRPVTAYEGPQPYTFICYSHEDAPVIYPELELLTDAGLKVWYDEGISPGSEWNEQLAARIEDCTVFLFFLSRRSAVSDHCRSEVNFALDQRCTILVVHLEETQLSPGLRLALGTRQMILRYELRRTPTRGSSLARSAP